MSAAKQVRSTRAAPSRGRGSSKARPRAAREPEYDGMMQITPSSGNVFTDLGFPPAEAENLLLRSQLMSAVMDVMERRRLSQVRAAKLFGVTQPRIGDLKGGKIDRFTLDALVNMLAQAGIKVRLMVGQTAA